jgi:predicted MPP superfamily phosphohydrolase
MVGDSGVGKSSLALRLAEDRFEERGSTLGMQIWALQANRLDMTNTMNKGPRREVFLWDLGGQAEYQLVNQLFMQDISAALVFFDPTRGEASYASVADWNRRLDTHSRGRQIRKILVRSRTDLQGGVVDQRWIDQFLSEHGYLGYFEVSARDGTGIERLGKGLNEMLDWEEMAKVTRPAVYQRLRGIISKARKQSALLFEVELERRLRQSNVYWRPEDLELVLRQLALEGQIVDVHLVQGDRVLILRIDAVSRYASSLLLSAREHPRGVPMLEPDRIQSAGMHFPGINEHERLDRTAERVLVECVVQLMLERGLCLQHAGTLVFPTLFLQIAKADGDVLPHPQPIYYDFDGPIDSIYAALVARIALSGEFGGVRLWNNRAEYVQINGSVFGLARRDRNPGKGHLDLYVSSEASSESRELFIRFVEDYLRSQDVEVLEGLAFACACGQFRFGEDLLRGRLTLKKDDVQCPACEKRYPLFRATGEPEQLKRRLRALKTETEQRSRQVVAEVKEVMAISAKQPTMAGPIRILHLSDLHLTGDRSVDQILQPLDADLHRALKIERLDYVVVSGDVTDKCNLEGFARATEFLEELMRRFGLNASRLILVPGNHDLDRNRKVYDLEFDERRALAVMADRRVAQGEVFLIRLEGEYSKRFEIFRNWYKGLTQEDYPEPHDEQGLLISYPEDGMEFLTLNSAWEIDRFHPERISINSAALSRALLRSKLDSKLRIAVWHHAVRGKRQVANQENISRLIQAGYRLCMHGDVHEEHNDLLNHLDPTRSLHVIGTGSFSSPNPDLPHAAPRLYNLLEIDRTLARVRVRSRAQKEFDGPFAAYAIYPAGDDPDLLRGDYWISLDHGGL